MPRMGRVVVLIVTIASVLAIPSTAQAADGPTAPFWNCRASVLRANIFPGVPAFPVIEPLVANDNDSPCADADQAVPEIAIPPAPAPGVITADAIFARTDVLCADDSADPADTPENGDECDAGRPSYDQQVVARAGAADVKIAIGDDLVITADAIDATAHASCDEATNQPRFDADTTFVNVKINDNAIELPPNGDELVIPLDPLIHIVFNERGGDPEGLQPDDSAEGSITRRALHVTVGGGDVADVVLGEAKVGYKGDVCPEGNVVVKQVTAPKEDPNTTNFGFETSAGLVPSPFSLQDDGEITFADVASGTHSVTQLPPAEGYQLDVIQCAENGIQDTTTNVANRRANIELQPGETVTCTFVDTKERVLPPDPGTCPEGSTLNANGDCIVDTTSCPAGSVKDPATQQCVVNCPAGSVKSPTGQCVITNVTCPDGTVFDKPSASCLDKPTGGDLVPLDQVAGYQTSPCRGARFGLAIAVVGTNGPNRITGTNRADRIFAYGGNDRVSGGRGNDCIEGGSGKDILDGSNGNDRLMGGSGNDRLQGGYGNDRLQGGSGNDGIHTGNGRDVVYGGAGNDTINAATVGPPAFVDCGPGKRDRVRINTNELNRTRNCEFRYILRRTKK